MLPNVRIDIQNDQLGGILAMTDGVCAMVCTGSQVNDKVNVGEPFLVFSLADAEEIGITVAENPVAHRHIKEFYLSAGTGTELYGMLVPDTTLQSDMLDGENEQGAVKLLDYAGGRVRLLFTAFEPDDAYDPDLTDGIDEDVLTAIVKAQLLADSYAAKQMPIRVIVEGRAFTDDASDLKDLHTMTNRRVAVVVGSSQSDGSGSVGLFAGRCAAIPVQRKASRVKDGPLPIEEAFVGSKAVDSFSGLSLMHDKGYIVLRSFSGVAGYFFSDDPTATATTDDYGFVARGRVIDKAHIIAYRTFIEELHDEVAIDDQGSIAIGVIKYLESKIENQIDQLMTANGEISRVVCTIDASQDVLSTDKLVVQLRLTPVGYSSDIVVELGFQNPQNN